MKNRKESTSTLATIAMFALQMFAFQIMSEVTDNILFFYLSRFSGILLLSLLAKESYSSDKKKSTIAYVILLILLIINTVYK